jgi:hypothetical protein
MNTDGTQVFAEKLYSRSLLCSLKIVLSFIRASHQVAKMDEAKNSYESGESWKEILLFITGLFFCAL